jgi:hypothetical protein
METVPEELMAWEDRCSHGNEGFCMLCVREGEGKPCTPHDPDIDENGNYIGPRFPGDYEKQWWED